jgi:hypothetical protein
MIHHRYNQKFVAVMKLAALCAATALCAVWLTATPAKAQYPWSDQPEYQTAPDNYGERGFTRPRHEESYEQRRQRESNSRQEYDRQEQERFRSYNTPSAPRDSNPYNAPEAIYGKDGKVTMCQKGFAGTTYCQ